MAGIALLPRLEERLGTPLARFPVAPRRVHGVSAPTGLEPLVAGLRPADVIVVDGATRSSTGIEVLAPSTCSHAAWHVGRRLGARRKAAGAAACALDAAVIKGVRAVGREHFAGMRRRVHRPTSPTPHETLAVLAQAIARIGRSAGIGYVGRRDYLRDHSRFATRDFNVAPCLQVVQPALAANFDAHRLEGADRSPMKEVPA